MPRLPLLAVQLLVSVAVGAGCVSQRLNERAFFPEQEFELLPEDLGLVPEAFVVETGGALLHGWRLRAQGDGDTLLVLGGNSSNKQLLLPLARSAVDHGYDVVLVDWRGFGLSTGKPELDRLVPDALAVAQHVRADPRTRGLALGGVSLGSAVALGVAAEAPEAIDALVIEGLLVPRYALREQLGGFGAFMTGWLVVPSGFDVEQHARELPMPILFVHGTEDELTPFEPASRVFVAAREASAPRAVWVAAGAGHAPGIAGLLGPEYDAQAFRFLDEHLRGAPRGPRVELDWSTDDERVKIAVRVDAAERTPVELVLALREAEAVVARVFVAARGSTHVELTASGEPVGVFASVPVGDVRELDDGSWVLASPRVEAAREAQRLAALTYVRLGYGVELLIGGLHGFITFEEPFSKDELQAACPEVRLELASAFEQGVDPTVALRHAELWRALGVRYAELEDEPAARDALERALELLPENPLAAWRFGDATWQLGAEVGELASALEALAAIAPDEPTRARDLARAQELRAAVVERTQRLEAWTSAQRTERDQLAARPAP